MLLFTFRTCLTKQFFKCDLFDRYGWVIRIYLGRHSINKASKAFTFITFAKKTEKEAILKIEWAAKSFDYFLLPLVFFYFCSFCSKFNEKNYLFITVFINILNEIIFRLRKESWCILYNRYEVSQIDLVRIVFCCYYCVHFEQQDDSLSRIWTIPVI